MDRRTDLRSWNGLQVLDVHSEAVGTLQGVLDSVHSGLPAFALVNVGRLAGLGTQLLPVPLVAARLEEGRLTVAFTRDRIRAATEVEQGVAALDADQEAVLYDHYEVGPQPPGPEPDVVEPDPVLASQPEQGGDGLEVVVSEERLHIDRVRRATERVRVRKFIVSEQVNLIVTLRREELRVERIEVADGDAGVEASDAVETGADEQELGDVDGAVEVVLRAERPVVVKRIVPVERVRLTTQQVAEEWEVVDELRKERVEIEQLGPPGGQQP